MDAIVLHHILRALDFHPVEANLRQSFRALAAGRPASDVVELAGLSIASLGVAFQMFNAAFLSGPVASPAELEQRLGAARAHFEARGIAWSLWVCEDWLERSLQRRLSQTCERMGLRISSELPGMAAGVLARPKRALPQVELRRVENPATLQHFRDVGAQCFRVPPVWFNEVFDENLHTLRGDFACWVGYDEEGVPVSTAATLVTEAATGLYNIATVGNRRGKGIGEATTRQAVERAGAGGAGDGSRAIVLQSTSAGLGMYERLGFRTVTRILVYNSIR